MMKEMLQNESCTFSGLYQQKRQGSVKTLRLTRHVMATEVVDMLLGLVQNSTQLIRRD